MEITKNEIQPGRRVYIGGYMFADGRRRVGVVWTRKGDLAQVDLDGNLHAATWHVDHLEAET